MWSPPPSIGSGRWPVADIPTAPRGACIDSSSTRQSNYLIENDRKTTTMIVLDSSSNTSSYINSIGIQCLLILLQFYGYGSIPINTIFSGMNILLPAILMWTTGVQGLHTLPFMTVPLVFFLCWVLRVSGSSGVAARCSGLPGGPAGLRGENWWMNPQWISPQLMGLTLW